MLLNYSPKGLLLLATRRWKRLLISLILCFAFFKYIVNSDSHTHVVRDHDIKFAAKHPPIPLHGFLPLSNTTALCKAQKWKPYPHRGIRRKVYDLFMLNDELDWLEIHLHTLSEYVDYFVIVESDITFTGLPKPLILKENWDRFKEWHHQIIYHKVENLPKTSRTWDYEDHQRNSMFLQTFPGLKDERKPRLGDVIIVADVDEIPRPATAMILRNCDIPRRVTIRSRFFYYSFQNEHVGEQWGHPQATIFGGLEKGQTILPADLRNIEGNWKIKVWWENSDLWNGAWHCSTCFDTIEQVLTKMRSFSHTSLNQEQFRDRTRIVDRVRKGLDLWDREGELYERVEDTWDVPTIISDDRTKWKYLVDRDASNAAFRDYGRDEDAGD